MDHTPICNRRVGQTVPIHQIVDFSRGQTLLAVIFPGLLKSPTTPLQQEFACQPACDIDEHR